MRGLKPHSISLKLISVYVASFTDAWIETDIKSGNISPKESHLLQMRGLKHMDYIALKNGEKSHLLQMRGLKLVTTI